MDNILEVTNLKVEFSMQNHTIYAVNDISYNLASGEILGVVGESGSGKSVSAMSILRLIAIPPGKIKSGKIIFNNQDLLTIPIEELRKIRGNDISMIYQDPMTTFNPVLKIGKQLSESLIIHKGYDSLKARREVVDLLNLVGIPNAEKRIDDYPYQFSGGMRQRALIAMALTCQPKILIADEPTTALDVTIQAQIINLIKKLKKQYNMSIIWISHDLGVIAGLADRVIVMYGGFIVEEAPATLIYRDPLHPYTHGLLRSIVKSENKNKKELLYSINGNPPIITEEPDYCPFYPRCAYATQICSKENPKLVSTAKNRRVACWNAEEIVYDK